MSSQRGTSAKSKRGELRPTDVRTWEIPGYGEVVQDPLTFFEKNEFLGLVASAIDRAIADGIDIEGLATVLQMDDQTAALLRKQGWAAAQNLPGVDKLIQAAMRIVAASPQLLSDAYLVALSIPPHQREVARIGLEQIDDDTGFGILDLFIKQNATVLRDFAMRWWEQVRGTNRRISEAEPEAEPAASTATSTG
jgi:hypothetical protein